jgi:uncharacterized SAM-binding protein YcdF (DUF218 family)
LACLLIIAALFLRRRLGWQWAILILALFLLWVGGNRWVSMGLTRSLEWQYLPPAELPRAEVIVLLGGGTRSALYPRQIVELGGGGTRVLYAAWLYHQGAAPYILASGGRIDWLESGNSAAEEMATILEMMDVPKDAIWLEENSRNTAENASECRKILQEKGINRIILVTSAFHMPRSVPLFEHQGFEVIPAPTDYSVTQEDWERLTEPNLPAQLINLLPSADQLVSTTRSLKEYLGMLVYRLRGW